MDTTSALRCASCGEPASQYTYLPANTLCDRQPYCPDCAARMTVKPDDPYSFSYPLSPRDAGGCAFNAFGGHVHEPLDETFSVLQGSEPGRELRVHVCRHCRCLYYCCEPV